MDSNDGGQNEKTSLWPASSTSSGGAESDVTNSLTREILALARLSVPLVLSSLMFMLSTITDSIFLGHISEDALAASGLANTWMYIWIAILSGMSSGVAVLGAQAYGNEDQGGDPTLLSLLLLRGLIVTSLTAVPVAAAWCFTGQFASLAGATPSVASKAALYSRILISSLPAQVGSNCLEGFLTAQDSSLPQLLGAFCGVICNVLLNYCLIWGVGLGFIGSPMATSITSWIVLLVQLAYMVYRSGAKDIIAGWRLRAAVARDGMTAYLRVTVPETCGFLLEEIGFDGLMILTATMGDSTPKVAAMAVVCQIYSVSYFVQYGIAEACAARIGNALGRCDVAAGQRTSWSALLLCGLPSVGLSLLFFFAGRELATLFTSEDRVKDLSQGALQEIAAAVLLDMFFVILTCGVLTGQGDTSTTAICRFVMLVIVAPSAWYLGVWQEGGLPGLWWGWLIGLGAVTIICMLVTYRSDWQQAVLLAQERLLADGDDCDPLMDSYPEPEDGRSSPGIAPAGDSKEESLLP